MRTWNQCDECGRYVSFSALETGIAVHRLLEPDSDLGGEKWETLCPLHYKQPESETMRCKHPKSMRRFDGIWCCLCGAIRVMVGNRFRWVPPEGKSGE